MNAITRSGGGQEVERHRRRGAAAGVPPPASDLGSSAHASILGGGMSMGGALGGALGGGALGGGALGGALGGGSRSPTGGREGRPRVVRALPPSFNNGAPHGRSAMRRPRPESAATVVRGVRRPAHAPLGRRVRAARRHPTPAAIIAAAQPPAPSQRRLAPREAPRASHGPRRTCRCHPRSRPRESSRLSARPPSRLSSCSIPATTASENTAGAISAQPWDYLPCV